MSSRTTSPDPQSCGPGALPQYQPRAGPAEFSFVFSEVALSEVAFSGSAADTAAALRAAGNAAGSWADDAPSPSSTTGTTGTTGTGGMAGATRTNTSEAPAAERHGPP